MERKVQGQMLGEMHVYGIGKQETEFRQHSFIRYLICVGLTMKKIFRVSDSGICIVDAEPDSKTHEQVRGSSE